MNLDLLEHNWRYLLLGNWPAGAPSGLLLTVLMSIAAGVIASIGGLAGGVLLTLGPAWLRSALSAVVAVLRAIPVIMLIFWCYFLMPILFGLDVPGVATVIFALALISAAYLSQSVKAGIDAVGRAQWEAGLSLGFTPAQTLRYLVLPQALRIMVPSFVNQWITLVKDTSLAYVVGVAELTFVANQVNSREQIYALQIFSLIGLGYFLLCGGISLLGRYLQQRWPPAGLAASQPG